MRLRTITLGIALLSATVLWAQDTASQAPVAGSAPTLSPGTAPVSRARNAFRNRTMMPAPRRALSADPAFAARLEDMQDTLTKLHALLKQMQSQAGSSKRQTVAAENIQMWELLLGHLDRTLAQARMTAIQRSVMDQRAPGGQNPGGTPNSNISVPRGAAAVPQP